VTSAAASLRHRVAAAPATDSQLATDLVAFAHDEVGRGAVRAGAANLILASRLSPEREDRERLLLEAVENLLCAGDVRQAAGFDAEIADFVDGAYRRYVLGRGALLTGRLTDAERLLTSAWERRQSRNRELGAKIATELSFVHRLSLRGSESLAWAERAVDLATGTSAAGGALGARTLGRVLVGRVDHATADTSSLAARSPEALDAHFLLLRGVARLQTDDVPGARADLSAVAALRTCTGWITIAAQSISVVADYRLGDWDAAIVHAELAISAAEAADFDLITTRVHGPISAVLAGRGEWAAATTHAERTAEVPIFYHRVEAAVAEAQIARARGDHRSVISALEPLVDMDCRETLDGYSGFLAWQDVHVEALVGVGRLDDAEAIVTPFEAWAAERGQHSAISRAARARGSLEAARGRVAQAEEAFRAGLRHAQQVPFPFDHALLELAYGGFLRRNGKRRRALALLGRARERLAQLGAQPYLVRCDRELAGSGLVHRRRSDPDRSRLTPQEASVARLVASGISNPQVAAELFVSVNTVEFHLKNVYRKLGIRSRDQLREKKKTTELRGDSLPPDL
jgi:DNA-binding CsgD family transcriptional regulator